MKVKLKNVGMLDEAEFEVGNITLICGENNTGKTYATYSLYGYLDFLSNNLTSVFFSIVQKHLNILIPEEYTIEISIDKIIAIYKDTIKNTYSDYKEKLSEILAGKDGDFDDSIFSNQELDHFLGELSNNDIVNSFKEFSEYKNLINLSEINNKYIKLDYKNDENFEIKDRIIMIKTMQLLTSFFLFLTPKYPRPFILSAERTGASMFQKELDVNKNEIVDRISQVKGSDIKEAVIDILVEKYSRYPKPVKDNIYFVRELDEVVKKTSFIQDGINKNSKNKNLYQNILDLLFEIVGGKYLVSQEGIEFAPGAKKRITRGKFLIQRASSSVRSLLILNHYILHEAQKGDILMIDEPELNLHPKNQILLARLFTLLANAGIKIFITTHSDYIVRELNNCIMLNKLSDEQIHLLKSKSYIKENKIDFNNIKAYIAKNIKGKNTLEEVKITEEEGIFMNTFDEPIDTQNENQSMIYEKISEIIYDK
ncbi:AAA family ATPase [Campylobacter jejuni]|uniref:AAA family ATPase n=1 Tax=Campylobacter jejuni TaxID=197 RepID=UPI00069B673C|nr:AAA family ATPase [Campylobacter jejuni]EAH4933245.1 ATP-binding protein [Campylobacter jejuni]EAI2669261.1 ATP-binding protein [Campylobacter jejuni]EAK4542692.1 ATP-binding protein [Campylobacter jejuni]EAL1700991.1 ATP-binding protein [Campylobacter jejuni]EAL1701258.1 ATP-binding protein [Campylobacter jejuni]